MVKKFLERSILPLSKLRSFLLTLLQKKLQKERPQEYSQDLLLQLPITLVIKEDLLIHQTSIATSDLLLVLQLLH
jgi:hypothetical protein